MTSSSSTGQTSELDSRLRQQQEAFADVLIERKLERIELEVLRLEIQNLELANERLQRAFEARAEDVQQLEERLRRALRSAWSMQEELRRLRQLATADRSPGHSKAAR
jgi:hypothetical protein